jgi:hypothetical protein
LDQEKKKTWNGFSSIFYKESSSSESEVDEHWWTKRFPGKEKSENSPDSLDIQI